MGLTAASRAKACAAAALRRPPARSAHPRRRPAHRRLPGRRGHHRRSPTGRVLAAAWRLGRTAADVTITAVLLAGVPWGLARLPGPAGGSPVIRVLDGAAWLLWAVFAAALAVEVTAAARGRPAPRLPAIGPLQALAAALAGATVITALHLPRTAPRAPQPARAVLTADAAAGHAGGGGQPRTYRVATGDDLWEIAERFLGSGEDWHQVFHLNQGKPQPDGRTLTDPDLIVPGWVLLIPQPPAAPPPAPARPAGPGPHSTGQPGGPSPRAAQPAPRSAQAGHRSPPAGAAGQPGPAVQLPSGALIGAGVAVMTAAAVTLAAVQRRRRYRPCQGPPGALQPGYAPACRGHHRAAPGRPRGRTRNRGRPPRCQARHRTRQPPARGTRLRQPRGPPAWRARSRPASAATAARPTPISPPWAGWA